MVKIKYLIRPAVKRVNTNAMALDARQLFLLWTSTDSFDWEMPEFGVTFSRYSVITV